MNLGNYKEKADVCLVLEGTYPYVRGGVSTWTHELIEAQSHLTFHILAILPPKGPDYKIPKMHYTLPKNIVSLTNVHLQTLAKGSKRVHKKKTEKLFQTLETPLLNMQIRTKFEQIQTINNALHDFGKTNNIELGSKILMDSDEAWNMLTRMYIMSMSNASFLDYFWTWRALMGGLFSMLLAPLPNADVYHGLCTGYAGVFLTRASIEAKKPCIVTEHGIYTNERRIEIASADWLNDNSALDLGIEKKMTERNLRDFWIDTFVSYSSICYDCCEHIITLYEGNKDFQIKDGADPEKLMVIPNGIDYEKFSAIGNDREEDSPPTIALIGRVVPIKDIKTFIRATAILQEIIPNVRAYIMGPTDEDEAYYEECLEIVEHSNLQKTIIFTGMVQLTDYLNKIDVQVLTSISEAQPLVILEAGANAIPSVCTDVGACREMIYGKSNEKEELGLTGAICRLTSPREVAEAIYKLLHDSDHYEQCAKNMQKRVAIYYNKKQQHQSYHDIYDRLITKAQETT